MIVVHLLLFSVLLYNTEAVFDDEYDNTTTVRSTAIKATIPVEDTTTTNRTETIGWYYGSTTVEKNETRDYKSVPVEDKRPANVTETTEWWSYRPGTVEKNETRNYKSVPVDDKRPATVTETTDRWSYGSSAVKKNQTWVYKAVPVENLAVVSDKEPAKLTYEFAVPKPYEDDVGYLTVDNSTLTGHFPKKGYEKKKKTKQVDWRNRHNTTRTRKPYYSVWYNKLENNRTTTESSYYRYNQTDNDSETTTTIRPYYLYMDSDWFNKRLNDIMRNYRTTTETSYYRYNQTVNDSETTTTRRPYYSNWDKETDGDKNKTAAPYYRYNKTVVESETTTTRIPYYWYWNEIIGNYKSTTETSYYRYNKTVNDSETATTWYNKRVESPIVNRANSSDQNVTIDQVNPKTGTSRHNPVNILINSSINANETRNYGAFTDFLKKISGYILPGASNIAPNSNITNLAVVNGNGNMFFYVG